ncbi:hypothetical protein HELRODRAFT_166886 [Helobdella robusta]|uniref:Uncharacterized protein n=1 Tax=Helobdella robusta TaxID=6412 RepID=T1EYP9_HELRO|nr:hypothetical protein HELRODRAFT_166886 [Helobdella robusta]ESO11831.1 hypothetical protein HELRODRAFT_166886 [Helobdella robusta]
MTGFLVAASDKSTNNGTSFVRSFDLNLLGYATETLFFTYFAPLVTTSTHSVLTQGFATFFADSSQLAKKAVATSFRTIVDRLYCPSSTNILSIIQISLFFKIACAEVAKIRHTNLLHRDVLVIQIIE